MSKKKISVRPHRRHNSKSEGSHRVKGHERDIPTNRKGKPLKIGHSRFDGRFERPVGIRDIDKGMLEASVSPKNIKEIYIEYDEQSPNTYEVQFRGDGAELTSVIIYNTEEDSKNNRETMGVKLRFNDNVSEKDAQEFERWVEENYDTTYTRIYRNANPKFGYYHLEFKMSSPRMKKPSQHYDFIETITKKYGDVMSDE